MQGLHSLWLRFLNLLVLCEIDGNISEQGRSDFSTQVTIASFQDAVDIISHLTVQTFATFCGRQVPLSWISFPAFRSQNGTRTPNVRVQIKEMAALLTKFEEPCFLEILASLRARKPLWLWPFSLTNLSDRVYRTARFAQTVITAGFKLLFTHAACCWVKSNFDYTIKMGSLLNKPL
jgi:hypothetical protein